MSPPYTKFNDLLNASFDSSVIFSTNQNVKALILSAFEERSYKIEKVIGSYPSSISVPLFIKNRKSNWVLPFLYICTSIHTK